MERTQLFEDFKISMALEGISEVLHSDKEYYWLMTDTGTDNPDHKKDYDNAQEMHEILSDFIKKFDEEIRLGEKSAEETIEMALKFFTKYRIDF